MSVKPPLFASSAKRRRSAMWAICSSVMSSQPSQLDSSVPVHSDASRLPQAAHFSRGAPLLQARLHRCRQGLRQLVRLSIHFCARLRDSSPRPSAAFRTRPRTGAPRRRSACRSLRPSRCRAGPGFSWSARRAGNVFRQARPRMPVIAKGIEGRRRNGVDGILADQFFHVHHVAVAGFFVLVLAQSTRCVCAPLAASFFQRSLSRKSSGSADRPACRWQSRLFLARLLSCSCSRGSLEILQPGGNAGIDRVSMRLMKKLATLAILLRSPPLAANCSRPAM